MDFNKKKGEAAKVIQLFLDKKATLQELQEYSWKIIDEFSNKNEENIPVHQEEESVFWFAIWQLQHLAGEEHLKDGTLERELRITLKYLLNQIPMPVGTYGLRPSVNNKLKHGKKNK